MLLLLSGALWDLCTEVVRGSILMDEHTSCSARINRPLNTFFIVKMNRIAWHPFPFLYYIDKNAQNVRNNCSTALIIVFQRTKLIRKTILIDHEVKLKCSFT